MGGRCLGGSAKDAHLGGRDPGREQVNLASNVLRHTEGCCEGVNGAGRVGENGKFCNFECRADCIYII